MPYTRLVQDVQEGGQGLLEIDPAITVRLLGSSRSEGSLLGRSEPTRKRPALLRAFRSKLQQASRLTAPHPRVIVAHCVHTC